MRYVPSPTKTRILFDKGEARAYNLPEWIRGVILDPITEIAANDTRKWEFLDCNCFLDKMAVNNPLIHDAYLAHANRCSSRLILREKVGARNYLARLAESTHACRQSGIRRSASS